MRTVAVVLGYLIVLEVVQLGETTVGVETIVRADVRLRFTFSSVSWTCHISLKYYQNRTQVNDCITLFVKDTEYQPPLD